MKKVLLAVMLCAVVSACSKDEPENNGKQPSKPEQMETQEVNDEDLSKYFDLDKNFTVL